MRYFEEGTKVMISNSSSSEYAGWIGTIRTIEESIDLPFPVYIVFEQGYGDWFTWDEIKKIPKYRVGDKVRCVLTWSFLSNKIGVIKEITWNTVGKVKYTVAFHPSEQCWILEEDEIIPYTQTDMPLFPADGIWMVSDGGKHQHWVSPNPSLIRLHLEQYRDVVLDAMSETMKTRYTLNELVDNIFAAMEKQLN